VDGDFGSRDEVSFKGCANGCVEIGIGVDGTSGSNSFTSNSANLTASLQGDDMS
jgi:hypothetical protein